MDRLPIQIGLRFPDDIQASNHFGDKPLTLLFIVYHCIIHFVAGEQCFPDLYWDSAYDFASNSRN